VTAPASLREDLHATLRRQRERCPVRRAGPGTGPGWWYLTRYADVRRVLRDPAAGRELGRLPGHLAARHYQPPDPLAGLRRNALNLDPPDHTRLRALLAPAFSSRATAAAGAHVAGVVGSLLDGLAAAPGPADLIRDLALPLQMLVVARVVGLPGDATARLRAWSDAIRDPADPPAGQRAGLELAAYLSELADGWDPREAGRPLSALVQARRSGLVSQDELVASLIQLLLGGDETTVSLIGNAAYELLRHPAELARLRDRPELAGPALDEVLRFNGPVGHSRPLYALADLVIGGTVIPRGDVVVPVLLAANRDPEVFPDPDVFDIGRNPNPHLGFGHGPHFCLGAPLARLQAQEAVGRLVRRFPRLALAADPDGLEWLPGLAIHGLRRLPVLLS
jgi:cytochrome P450